MQGITGVYLPIITPFKDYKIDYAAYKKLIEYYIKEQLSGIVPLGTTGEGPVIEEKEYFEFVEKTLEFVDSRVPVILGFSSNHTRKAVNLLKKIAAYPLAGLLVASPYYNRPSQEGLYQHFLRIAENTPLEIIMYNIPYRTGRNMENSTILRLSELDNIVGIKDSCGDIRQTLQLLNLRPDNFSILTGEDILFFLNLTHGGQGGIMASAHFMPRQFLSIYRQLKANNYQTALATWQKLLRIIPHFFCEPNPAPLKYLLYRQGLIDSAETREPLTGISGGLKTKLDEISALSVTGVIDRMKPCRI